MILVYSFYERLHLGACRTTSQKNRTVTKNPYTMTASCSLSTVNFAKHMTLSLLPKYVRYNTVQYGTILDTPGGPSKALPIRPSRHYSSLQPSEAYGLLPNVITRKKLADVKSNVDNHPERFAKHADQQRHQKPCLIRVYYMSTIRSNHH